MVSKLIRDDIKTIYLRWQVILLPALLVYFASLVSFGINLPILSGFSAVVAVLSIIVIAGSLPVIQLIHYYRSFYSNEGYLTMTLPVTGRQLYISKFVANVGYLLGDVVLLGVLLSVFSLAVDFSGRMALFTTIRLVFDQFRSFENSGLLLLVIVLYILYAIFQTVVSFCFAISKGCEAKLHHLGLGGPIIWYVITYLISQVVTFAGMLLFPVGVHFDINPIDGSPENLRLVFESGFGSLMDTLRGIQSNDFTFGIGFIPLMLLVSAIYIIFTLRSLERHTSLR